MCPFFNSKLTLIPFKVAAPTSSTSSSSESEEADQPEAPSPLEKQKSILELLEDAVDLFDWCVSQWSKHIKTIQNQ